MTRAGDGDDQGKDRSEQQDDCGSYDGDRLHDQRSRLPDALVPGGHLLSGGHDLARREPAEYAQHRGELGVGPEQAGLDTVKLVLLAVVGAGVFALASPRGFPGLQLASALLGAWLIIAGPILSQKHPIADPMYWSNSWAGGVLIALAVVGLAAVALRVSLFTYAKNKITRRPAR